MDMFVDLLDAQLQRPEDYAALVTREDGPAPVNSHLNKLITAASDAARACNALPTEVDYSVLSNVPSFASRVSGLSAKCAEVISSVDPLFRKIGMDNYADMMSSQAFEALSQEIYLGLRVHHNDPHQRVSAFQKEMSEVPKKKLALKDLLSSSLVLETRDGTSCDPEARLETIPLRINLVSYNRVPQHRQYRWNHLIDNFSLRRMHRPELPKFNSIDPCVTLGDSHRLEPEGPAESDPGGDRSFMPMVYPRFEDLNTQVYNRGRVPTLPHPYTAELNALEWSDTLQAHSHRGRQTLGGGSLLDPNVHVSGPTTSCKKCRMVQTLADLETMIAVLKGHSIIAVDVEHHSSQSYRGFVCLVQITGAGYDWVIDPFEMFDQMWRLNEVTTDPRILKVMHGAESDVLWLQRDFSVYVVNLFDTLKAADVLCLSCGHSLSSLVEHFLGVHLDKSYQLADWRVRPIPRGMLAYASADTHYLLDLYSKLKNLALELDAKSHEPGTIGCADNRILRIMVASRKVCLRQYKEPAFNEVARGFQAFRKNRQCPSRVDYLSLNVMLNLVSLRNYAARVLDESDTFLVPDYAIALVATAGDSKNSGRTFAKAVTRHMALLENEMPYVIRMRNSLRDALEMVIASGMQITEPIPLINLVEMLRHTMTRIPPAPAYPAPTSKRAGTRRSARFPRSSRARSKSVVFSDSDPEALKSALEVYRSLRGVVDPASMHALLAAPTTGMGPAKQSQYSHVMHQGWSNAFVALNGGQSPSGSMETLSTSVPPTSSTGRLPLLDPTAAANDGGAPYAPAAKPAAGSARMKSRRSKRGLRRSRRSAVSAASAVSAVSATSTSPKGSSAKVKQPRGKAAKEEKTRPKPSKNQPTKDAAAKTASAKELPKDPPAKEAPAKAPKVKYKAPKANIETARVGQSCEEATSEATTKVPSSRRRRHCRRRRRPSAVGAAGASTAQAAQKARSNA
ncbi:exosome component 10-like protein [Babesia caballi]|uniref:Exosome component 10-like protein n=1 Tax=Babesia caballi TaxID=5871 RepID=A0AAV4LZB8_BABCB|nr:exosome component 10-like protein [Babesia caballi]